MKKLLCLLLLSVSSVAWAQYERPTKIQNDVQPVFVLVPQAGFNISRLSTDAVGKGRIGFQLGINAQIGRQFYFQPGVLLRSSAPQLVSEGEDQVLNKDVVPLLGVQFQGLGGYRVINSDIFKLRVHAGPAATFVTSVGDNAFDLTANDVKGGIWGLKAGGGIDVYFITLDLNYEVGLSKVFQHVSNARNNVLSVNLGVRLDL